MRCLFVRLSIVRVSKQQNSYQALDWIDVYGHQAWNMYFWKIALIRGLNGRQVLKSCDVAQAVKLSRCAATPASLRLAHAIGHKLVRHQQYYSRLRPNATKMYT